MGADLYINKIRDKEGGYFRDSYNVSNILWRLGLSYWELDKEYDFKDGNMSVEQAKDFLNRVLNGRSVFDRFIKEELTEKWLKDNHATAGVKGWIDYWRTKYYSLVQFLNRAIELDSPIYWSV